MDKPLKPTKDRKDRVITVEFPTSEEKAKFYEFCHEKGQTPAKIVKILIDKYVKGDIKL